MVNMIFIFKSLRKLNEILLKLKMQGLLAGWVCATSWDQLVKKNSSSYPLFLDPQKFPAYFFPGV